MKKIFLLSFMVVCGLMANESELLKKISNLPSVKAHKFSPLKVHDKGEVYMVEGQIEIPKGAPMPMKKAFVVMYLTKDMKVAIYGQGFDTATGKMFTVFSYDETKKLTDFTYGSGKKELFLFIDPLCPVCMQFDKDLPKFAKEYKFNVILMPLVRLHPEAPKAIDYIMSKKDDAEKFKALSSIAKGDKPYKSIKKVSKKTSEKIKKNLLLSSKLRVPGTPTLIDADGQPFNRGVLYNLQNYKK